MSGLANVKDILIANIKPVNGKTKFRVVTVCETQVIAKPIASAFGVVRQYEHMLKKFKSHDVFLSCVLFCFVLSEQMNYVNWQFIVGFNLLVLIGFVLGACHRLSKPIQV
jgi:small basic protein